MNAPRCINCGSAQHVQCEATKTARWVLSHIEDATGLRRLTLAMQGRRTYDTKAEAESVLRDFGPENPVGLCRVLSPTEMASMRVDLWPCWGGHHDPARFYAIEELQPAEVQP